MSSRHTKRPDVILARRLDPRRLALVTAAALLAVLALLVMTAAPAGALDRSPAEGPAATHAGPVCRLGPGVETV